MSRLTLLSGRIVRERGRSGGSSGKLPVVLFPLIVAALGGYFGARGADSLLRGSRAPAAVSGAVGAYRWESERRVTPMIRGEAPELVGRGPRARNLWIQSAIKRPGQLHRDLGIPMNQRIPLERLRWAARQPGKLGQRGRLALTLRSFHRS